MLRAGGGLYASRLYPFLGKPESFESAGTILSSRFLEYNPDQIEAFTSSPSIFSVLVSAATRWEIFYQPAEAFSSVASVLSGARVDFGSIDINRQLPESFSGSAALISSTVAQFVRIGLDFQQFEAFTSSAELVGAESSTTRVPLQSQAPEAFSSAAVVIAASLQDDPGGSCGVLGPFDLCFNVVPDGTANLNLNSTQ